MAGRLGRRGFEVKGLQDGAIAHDGLTALDTLNQSNFQLALLDLGLLAMDGETVLQTLRSRSQPSPVLTAKKKLHHDA